MTILKAAINGRRSHIDHVMVPITTIYFFVRDTKTLASTGRRVLRNRLYEGKDLLLKGTDDKSWDMASIFLDTLFLKQLNLIKYQAQLFNSFSNILVNCYGF
ncbi:hypothetical protein AQ505_11455 [Pedobacter sp. PACM 27299]|uniref:hypothetical protein n=1 Tax=Pedobacter sp. PACM 27299 TaxID=1727164 RepID=UPI0007064085|nr:hypothetical protein [Pedobacter sp. PACM 27299]ALL06053.1 hypothetical protein AQ505_11455 [Pedobacter sp. PACM 27299]